MKLIIQRVTEASVSVNGLVVSQIGQGILVLLGIHQDDDELIAKKLAHKLPKIRLWSSVSEDNEKPWSKSAQDNGYEILVVSQFTLYSVMKGNKPDFHQAKKANEARILYDYFIQEVQMAYAKDKVQGGAFQQMMKVALINDGPVTIEIDEFSQPKQKKNIKDPNFNDEEKQQFTQE